MTEVPHPLPEQLVVQIAERFRLLAEPMRIKLLDRLRDGVASVGELAEVTGSSQQNVSKHLGALHSSGLVARERDRNFVRYRIADPTIFELCELVCGRMREQVDELDRLIAGETS